MKRTKWVVAVGLICATTLGVTAATADGAPKDDTGKLKVDEDFADPGVVRGDDGLFYAFSSQTDIPTTAAAHVPVARSVSTNPAGEWQSSHDDSGARVDALPDTGAWTETSNPQLWAPDVSARPGGGYLMLYSALTRGSNVHCVGMATADHLGPDVHFDAAPTELFCGPDDPDGKARGVIDPAVFVDTDGSRYLVYKVEPYSEGDRGRWLPSEIHLRKFVDLGPQGLRWDGEQTQILTADPSFDDPENGQLEAPSLVHHGDHYVLFYSASWYNNPSYYTGYATSPTLTGDYQKSDTPLLSSDVQMPAAKSVRPHDGCVPGSADQLSGPGGATAFSDGASDYIAYHGIWTCAGGDLATRALYLDRLAWTADDLPYIP